MPAAIIVLGALLLATLGYIAHLRGIIDGMKIESNNALREWNDGYARARDFFEERAEELTKPLP